MPIGRRDVADLLGTTPETLSRNIHSLARRGAIRIVSPQLFELQSEGKLLECADDLLEYIEVMTGLLDRPERNEPGLEQSILDKLRKTA